jgi:hypothetical protein
VGSSTKEDFQQPLAPKCGIKKLVHSRSPDVHQQGGAQVSKRPHSGLPSSPSPRVDWKLEEEGGGVSSSWALSWMHSFAYPSHHSQMDMGWEEASCG